MPVSQLLPCRGMRGGVLRQAGFVSLRDDKPPGEVHLEGVKKASAEDAGFEVAGISITHPGRVVFPGDEITKLDVARYYEQAGERMMPYLRKRPLALLRAPGGTGGKMFFQKSFKDHVPPHVKVRTLPDGTEVIFIGTLKGLVSLVQYGVIELHPWGASLENIEKPDQIVWDLDPDKPVPWKETLGAAFLLRDYLAERDLETRVKTSGGKGLHVVLSLKRHHTWEVMKPFAKAVAAAVSERNPGRFTIHSSFAKRSGKIYIDWLRNGRGATCIAPWALRARPGAPVSMPLDWADLADLQPGGFTIRDPLRSPADWENAVPQSIPISLIRDLGAG